MLALSTYGFVCAGLQSLHRIHVRPNDEALDDCAGLAVLAAIVDLIDDDNNRLAIDFRWTLIRDVA
jgi:hypothetical protein